MRYLSVCSGIEAASAAWHDPGFMPAAFSEIEKFPCAVLSHHYPHVPNLGDMTKFKEWPNYEIDLLVGGTPCQSFSVAGLRKGLEDHRGNLMLTFLGIADKYKPKWIVWENVPGVLSSGKGRDFGTFLGALAELGYGWAYRVLDAQYFGVPQRRRRVFVVGCLGDWKRAASVLFEPESLRRDSAPSRKAGEEVAPTVRAGSPNGGKGHGARSGDSKDELVTLDISPALRARANASHRLDSEAYVPDVSGAVCAREFKGPADPDKSQGTPLIAHTLTKRCDGSPDGTGRGYNVVAIQDGRGIEKGQNGMGMSEGPAYTLDQTGAQAVAFSANARPDETSFDEIPSALTKSQNAAVAFTQNQNGDLLQTDVCPSMGTNQNATGRNTPKALAGMQVRRLTPRECERLQGFPDDYTLIPWRGGMAPDGPRYKALGNSMAVPVMQWIGKRISFQEVIS